MGWDVCVFEGCDDVIFSLLRDGFGVEEDGFIEVAYGDVVVVVVLMSIFYHFGAVFIDDCAFSDKGVDEGLFLEGIEWGYVIVPIGDNIFGVGFEPFGELVFGDGGISITENRLVSVSNQVGFNAFKMVVGNGRNRRRLGLFVKFSRLKFF